MRLETEVDHPEEFVNIGSCLFAAGRREERCGNVYLRQMELSKLKSFPDGVITGAGSSPVRQTII